ncbi:shikimate kinase [Campylobacter sp. MIT 21-1685]|uniref:shikimate kinase n=1 Tax=unclassified Campylobacter TaxID=2593542 RepID=UPI00224AF04C|nr:MULTISPECIES: shikimate kinase [unclassified Campylobacter]MCX2683265.1 shikimate kinase [Campylobacter sp. MIT 21-1684]MCX2751542.1 shikimate kinase [Campylobacter sp. MIT 21-1682]MCX2807741.1 shikimate kinase [Campylobacter sp. MIT 21-1685]
MKVKNVVFIGFMGCGKSTLARRVARELDLVFLDSDDLIEAKFQKSIHTLFCDFGEEFFRKEEQKMANFFSTIQGASIATGGGFIYTLNLEKIGFCIYLKADFESLKERLCLQEIAKRPLFNDTNKAKKLYNERVQVYEKKASMVIDIKEKTIQQLVDEVKEAIE